MTVAQEDWGILNGGLTSSDVRSGPTSGVAAPYGGGNHVYGIRSVSGVAGAFGLYCVGANFSPTPAGHGGRITAALRRASLGASNGFAPFMFFCAATADIGASAYVLGMSDESASHIQLRKGTIGLGMPAISVLDPKTAPNVLLRSSNTFAPDVWQHLRLDVVVQGTGDVLVQVFRNDLTLHSVQSPVWATVPGMEGPFAAGGGGAQAFTGFVDDNLGINTASLPLTAGFMGYGGRFEVADRALFIDHVTCDRQL